MSLAIFPAGQPAAPAVRTVRSEGRAQVDLPAGSYELCSGRDPTPTATARPHHMEFCQRFDVGGGVVRISATGGAMGSVGFSCAVATADVCK